MDTIKDLLASIKAQLGERMANPFTGAFAISWAICNFRLFIVVFGEGDITTKLAFIDAHFYPMWSWEFAIRVVIAPAIASYLYVFQYPKFSYAVMKHHRGRQNALRSLATQMDNEAVLTVENAIALRHRHASELAILTGERDVLNQRLADAQAALRKREEEKKPQLPDEITLSVPTQADPVPARGKSNVSATTTIRTEVARALVSLYITDPERRQAVYLTLTKKVADELRQLDLLVGTADDHDDVHLTTRGESAALQLISQRDMLPGLTDGLIDTVLDALPGRRT